MVRVSLGHFDDAGPISVPRSTVDSSSFASIAERRLETVATRLFSIPIPNPHAR
ncbi:hypothetical protein QA600_13490 [Natronococcus sp. A-GB1]|uniref:hypothetical protein n=1 Tax=Natronococcus sp. A-GB1 TaxID=3037648 RepID=UPI00241EBF94|nr:hypothetical protein [Natronococcus sp. A-GB1]MDG5760350.1 hypothetical protein [Natronococcus sp. A-GB1]